ncbi:hypothetical protein MFUR16E_21560 [Methylobacterium fujisawaense]|uniref:hypothetical protein n=1 Tax=Methylobacterium fujisawaense TaxID=107400 RepID=UPI002F2D9B99
MTRPFTTDGWTAQDDARAARIQVKRTRQGVVIQEDAPWQTDATPFITAGVDVQRVSETRVYLVRPAADGASHEIIGFPFVDEGA